MSSEDERAENYMRGVRITFNVVRDWAGGEVRFRFPPSNMALFFDLRDGGDKLANNDAAQEMVKLMIKQCVEATGEAPTATMLRAALDTYGCHIEEVPVEELKFEHTLIPISEYLGDKN